MTALIQFVVLKRNGRWCIKSRDLERSFAVPRKAINAAIRMANECGKEGNPAVVIFQKTTSDFETIWTYGKDQYPPGKPALPPLPETPEPPKLMDALG